MAKQPFYVAKVKRFFYLPSGYKHKTNKKVHGEAESGEISPKGLVTEEEDWEGRQSVLAQPSTIHYTFDRSMGKFRSKTMKELMEEGKFRQGHGPTGVMRGRT